VLLFILTVTGATLYEWNADATEMKENCDRTGDCVVVFDPAWNDQ
jgi:hypothetical protein